MALTQEQWNTKIRGFVPVWYFENNVYSKALFEALSKVLSEMQTISEQILLETFIASANGSYLDLHGSERSIARLSGETDEAYSLRIRNLTNNTNKIAIKLIVDEFLLNGECLIREDYDSLLFFDREEFCNRNAMFLEAMYNGFTISFDNQIALTGSGLTNDQISDFFRQITESVDNAKALGTMYRVVERV